MPRFFFDTDDASAPADVDGVELPNLAAARDMALRYAGECLMSHPQDCWDRGEWRLVVRDESRATLFSVQVLVAEPSPLQMAVLPSPAA